jgi:hypothetical protein
MANRRVSEWDLTRIKDADHMFFYFYKNSINLVSKSWFSVYLDIFLVII